MTVIDVLYNLMFAIIGPIVGVFSLLFDDFQDSLSFSTPIDIYLFSDNKLFSITPNEILFISLAVVILVVVIKVVFKFIKWLFSIPKKIGGLK